MLYGFIAAIPAIILGGPVYARFIAPRMTVRPDQALLDQFTGAAGHDKENGGVAQGKARARHRSACGAVAGNLHARQHVRRDRISQGFDGRQDHGLYRRTFDCHACSACSSLRSRWSICAAETPKSCAKSLGASLKPIAGILLIIAGGGAFKEVLVKANVGDAIVHLTNHFALPPLVLGWTDRHVAFGRHRIGNGRNCRCGRAAGAAGAEQSGPQSAAARALDRLGLLVLQLCQSRRFLAGEEVPSA